MHMTDTTAEEARIVALAVHTARTAEVAVEKSHHRTIHVHHSEAAGAGKSHHPIVADCNHYRSCWRRKGVS